MADMESDFLSRTDNTKPNAGVGSPSGYNNSNNESDDFEQLDPYQLKDHAEEPDFLGSSPNFGGVGKDEFGHNLHSTNRPLVTFDDPSPTAPSAPPSLSPVHESNITGGGGSGSMKFDDPEFERQYSQPGYGVEKDLSKHGSGGAISDDPYGFGSSKTSPSVGGGGGSVHLTGAAPELDFSAFDYNPDSTTVAPSSTTNKTSAYGVADKDPSPDIVEDAEVIDSTNFEADELEEDTAPAAACFKAPPIYATIPEPQLVPLKMESPTKSASNVSGSESGATCSCPFRAWFNPQNLDPRVVELIYWRDPKKSGIVFGSLLLTLLSLTYFSLISVVAYLSLAVLTGTLSFRIYKNVLAAVQKSNEGHPFKQFLELNLAISGDQIRDIVETVVAHVNAVVHELRRLILVEDLVDSIKFGVMLWCLTYVGAWFNGLTLLILAFVGAFTLPKVYETNQTQIDHYIGIVNSQVNDVMSKVKAKLPVGRKPKEQ